MRASPGIRKSSAATEALDAFAGATEPPITDAEVDYLFSDLASEPALLLAVSGGPDSTALMWLAARWRERRKGAPRLVAVTIDHGLRPQARLEAAEVKRLARTLGIEHRTLRWAGAKPSTGLQQKARHARYSLLEAAARRAKARCVLTAHTLDDQAETVLLRLARGSGPSGLAGMAPTVPLAALVWPDRQPGRAVRNPARIVAAEVLLKRPFLVVPKARLIATLRAAGLAYAEDPSNVDPQFTRARLRKLLPALAQEGLTPRRLTLLAGRIRRSEAALDSIVSFVAARIGLGPSSRKLTLRQADLREMPAEIALRLLGRAIGVVGDEGPVELGKLESLSEALWAAIHRRAPSFRRTLAGALVSLQSDCMVIERAPARRHRRA